MKEAIAGEANMKKAIVELANVKQAITEPVIAEEAIAEQGIMEQVILAAAGPAVWAAAVASPEAVALAERLSEMFPNTPLDYLLHRCEDLAGHDSAIERFTEELLADSRPLPGWLAAGQEAGAGRAGWGRGPASPTRSRSGRGSAPSSCSPCSRSSAPTTCWPP
jgi:hypothetical protein